jgi:protein-disulfide isomerase
MLTKSEQGVLSKSPWYKKGWVIFGLFLSFFVILGLLVFAVKVYGYYQEIKHGVAVKDFMPIAEPTAAMKMQNVLVQQERVRLKNTVKGREGEPFAGDKESVNEIVIFHDYGCPYCKMSVETIFEIKNKRPDIKISIRDYPIIELHQNSFDAAKAARCVWSQGKNEVYWRFFELLYNRQNQQDAYSLREYAREIGADINVFNSCMNQTVLTSAINQSILDAEMAGVNATPTFFVNGIKLEGVYDASKILKLIE